MPSLYGYFYGRERQIYEECLRTRTWVGYTIRGWAEKYDDSTVLCLFCDRLNWEYRKEYLGTYADPERTTIRCADFIDGAYSYFVSSLGEYADTKLLIEGMRFRNEW